MTIGTKYTTVLEVMSYGTPDALNVKDKAGDLLGDSLNVPFELKFVKEASDAS